MALNNLSVCCHKTQRPINVGTYVLVFGVRHETCLSVGAWSTSDDLMVGLLRTSGNVFIVIYKPLPTSSGVFHSSVTVWPLIQKDFFYFYFR